MTAPAKTANIFKLNKTEIFMETMIVFGAVLNTAILAQEDFSVLRMIVSAIFIALAAALPLTVALYAYKERLQAAQMELGQFRIQAAREELIAAIEANHERMVAEEIAAACLTHKVMLQDI